MSDKNIDDMPPANSGNNQESDTSITRVESTEEDAAGATNAQGGESTQNLEVQEQ